MKHLQLRTIINNHDPINLLSMGAPKDEYDPEVKSILSRLRVSQSKKEVERVVLEEFTRMFGESIIKDKEKTLKKIAHKITEQV